MSNILDSKLSEIQKKSAEKIIQEYELKECTVTFNEKTNSLIFKQDRRVVSVPLKLIENGSWGDIRFLFRAILEAPNSIWNHAADRNDWSGNNFYKKE